MSSKWTLEMIEIRAPREFEVLVKMYATGICQSDVVFSSVPAGTLGVHYPRIVGHEGAGTVVAVGPHVQSVKPGDRVLLSFAACTSCTQCNSSHPAYCEAFDTINYPGEQGSAVIQQAAGPSPVWTKFFGQSSLAGQSIVRVESIINVEKLLHNDEELKLFAPLGCGIQTGMGAVQNFARATPAETVVILGVGAVGMGALMTAKLNNCKAIVAVDRVASRLETALALGATCIINTSDDIDGKTSLKDSILREVPTGASVVIDTTGVPMLLEQAIGYMSKRGKLILLSTPSLTFELRVVVRNLLFAGQSIIGCIEGDCDPAKDIPQMIQWYREGRFPVDMLTTYYNVDDFEQALEGFHNGSVIKPVLLW